MMFRGRWFLPFLLIPLLILPTSQSYSSGIGEQADNGCVCHGAERELDTQAHIDGLPERFNSSQTYNLTLWMESDISSDGKQQGGFMLWFSAGSFSYGDEAQMMEGRLTHTDDGNGARGWSVKWTAPVEDDIQVDMKLYANAVDGDGEPTGDAWHSTTVSTAGVNFTGDLKEPNVPGGGDPIPSVGLFSTVAILALSSLVISSRTRCGGNGEP